MTIINQDYQKNYSQKLITLPNIAIDFDLPNLSKIQASKKIIKINKNVLYNDEAFIRFLEQFFKNEFKI